MRSYSPDTTYNLSDLDDWAFDGVSLAVLGHPVQHSVSPQMHNAAIAELSKVDPIFSAWRYFKFDIEAERLPEALPLFYNKGFTGLNLTVPHKEVAFGCIEQKDSAAENIGAINTLLRTDSGYKGFNTDGYGLSSGIKRDIKVTIKGSEITLLGAGGAARAAAIQCLEENCKSLTIVNRNQERLDRLISDIQGLAKKKGIPLEGKAPSANLALAENSLIINATSLGLKADDPLPIQVDQIPSRIKYFDMIYNPPVTSLMKEVYSLPNGIAANGLSMLIYQGARALEIWSNKTAPVETMFTAASAALSK